MNSKKIIGAGLIAGVLLNGCNSNNSKNLNEKSALETIITSNDTVVPDNSVLPISIKDGKLFASSKMKPAKLISSDASSVTYEINSGFNFLGYALNSEVSAQELLSDPNLESVFRFNETKQAFDFILKLPNGLFGTDFNLESQRGYVIKANQNTNKTIQGQIIENKNYNLSQGFNFLGATSNADSATDILKENSNLESIFRWDNTLQSFGFVLKISEGNYFGTDFKISKHESYFIRSNSSFTLNIQEPIPNTIPEVNSVLLTLNNDTISLTYNRIDPDTNAINSDQINWYIKNSTDTVAQLQNAFNNMTSIPRPDNSENKEIYVVIKPYDTIDYGTETSSNLITIEKIIQALQLQDISAINVNEDDLITVTLNATGGVDPKTYYLEGILAPKFTQNNNVYSWQTAPGDKVATATLTAKVVDANQTEVSQNFSLTINQLYYLLSGNIKDMNDSSLNVANAQVSLNGKSVLSDANGNYSIYAKPSTSTFKITHSDYWNREILNFTMPSRDGIFDEVIMCKNTSMPSYVNMTHINECGRWKHGWIETPIDPSLYGDDYERFPGVNTRFTTVPKFYIHLGTPDFDPMYEMDQEFVLPIIKETIRNNISTLTNNLINESNLEIIEFREPLLNPENMIIIGVDELMGAGVTIFSTVNSDNTIKFADIVLQGNDAGYNGFITLRGIMKALGCYNDGHSTPSLLNDPIYITVMMEQDYKLMKWKYTRDPRNSYPDKDDFITKTNYIK